MGTRIGQLVRPWVGVVVSLAFACESGSSETGGDVTETGGSEGADGTDGAGGTVSQLKVTNTTVSGLVKDATTGKPLFNISITTEPPTESTTTASTGQFVINVGKAFGAVTVIAQSGDYIQAFPTCLYLKSGVNNLADVTMARKVPVTDQAECFPACAAGTVCLSGACISACNPQCKCTEYCTAEAACVTDPDAPPSGTCGLNSLAVGGLCQCDTGFVPSGDGETCSLPSELQTCPEGAVRNEGGVCECEAGKIPNATGDKCLSPDQALTVTAANGGSVVREWATPGPAPRGLALHGSSLWVGDIATRHLYRCGLSDGAVVAAVDLADRGAFVVDLASLGDQLLIVYSGSPSSPAGTVIERFDPTTSAFEDVTPGDVNQTVGVSFNGFEVLSLDGLSVNRRRPDNLFVTAPTAVLLAPEYVSAQYAIRPQTTLRYLAYTNGQYFSWVGTDFDGQGLRTDLTILNAVNQVQATEIGRLSLYVGASHITGIEASGNTLWLAGAGAGNAVVAGKNVNPPKVVEVSLD